MAPRRPPDRGKAQHPRELTVFYGCCGNLRIMRTDLPEIAAINATSDVTVHRAFGVAPATSWSSSLAPLQQPENYPRAEERAVLHSESPMIAPIAKIDRCDRLLHTCDSVKSNR